MNVDQVVPHPLDVNIDDDTPTGIVINPASAYGKELRRWEQHSGPLGRPGNPYVFRAYPKMLYRAQRQPNGQVACMMDTPLSHNFLDAQSYERALLLKETFDRTCQKVVDSEGAERMAKGQGWCESPADAMAQYDREQEAIFTAAAEVAYAAQGMSDQAKAELKAADDQTHEHVVDVKPTKQRGRRAVAAVAASGPVEQE